MAISTIWIFGDSFDLGLECSVKGCDYHDNYKKEGDSHYSLHLGKKLKMNIINNAKAGFGPYHTVYNLAKQLKNIKPNDYVIAGMSDVNRLVGFTKDILDDSKYRLSCFSPWSKEDENIRNNMNHISPDYFNIVEKYLITCVAPTVGEHTEFVHNIVKWMIQSTNCKKSFTYHVDTWVKFESILEATDGKLYDHHWSYKGHRDFADFIMEKWVENDHINIPQNDIQKKFVDATEFPEIKWSPKYPDNDPYNNPIKFKKEESNKEDYLTFPFL